MRASFQYPTSLLTSVLFQKEKRKIRRKQSTSEKTLLLKANETQDAKILMLSYDISTSNLDNREKSFSNVFRRDKRRILTN